MRLGLPLHDMQSLHVKITRENVVVYSTCSSCSEEKRLHSIEFCHCSLLRNNLRLELIGRYVGQTDGSRKIPGAYRRDLMVHLVLEPRRRELAIVVIIPSLDAVIDVVPMDEQHQRGVVRET